MMFQTRLDFFKENILLWAFLEGSVLHILTLLSIRFAYLFLYSTLLNPRPVL